MSYPSKLYRYTKLTYAKSFVNAGEISFGSAYSYKDSKLTDAQNDDESSRTVYPDLSRHRVEINQIPTNLTKLSVKQNIKNQKGGYLRYFILCCSLDEVPENYAGFKAECCIVIEDAPEFVRRLEAAVPVQLPGWKLDARPVSYYRSDMIQPMLSYNDLVFQKDAAKYESQKEFRFALFAPTVHNFTERVTVKLGPIVDLCTIVPDSGVISGGP